MSLLIDRLLEVIFGGGWSKETPRASSEFSLDESSASIAAFLALLGLLCAVAVILPTWGGRLDSVMLAALAVSVGFAALAILVGKRTFRVTKRGWPLARVALWTARLTILTDARCAGTARPCLGNVIKRTDLDDGSCESVEGPSVGVPGVPPVPAFTAASPRSF